MTRRGLRTNSALALAGDSAMKLSTLVVVLVAARTLTVPEFAVLATALAVAGVLSTGLDIGAGTLVTRDGARSRTERGRLLVGSLQARLPVFVVVLVAAPIVGSIVHRPWTALAVAALGVTGAVTLTVLGCYRSCQDIRPEALQRLAAGSLTVVAAGATAVVAPDANALLFALVAVGVVTVLPLVLRLRTIATLDRADQPLEVLRRAAPIGLLALATIAYYRSGTIALAALSDAEATAVFGVASGVAFGLLMLPNAITTALLPRLAVERERTGVIECTRRTLIWTTALAGLLACASATVVPEVLPALLGAPYGEAGAPFVLLCIGIPLIAASGVIGTALLSIGRVRLLGVQVAVSLVVNLICIVVLVPVAGASGAALATLICEAVGLVFLVHVTRSALPGLVLPVRDRAPAIDASTAVP